MTNLKEKTAQNKLERTIENRNYAELFKLGCDYFEQKKFDFAAQVFTQAIQLDANNYEVYFERSRCYFCMENYDFFLTDCNKAIQLNPNFARAYRGIGRCYQKQKNDELALEWFRKSAELGDMSAQIELGQCYYFGKGAEKDYIQAVKWFEKAAEQGNKIAQGMLGNCYYFGNGVEKNYIQAVQWFEKSSEQGNAIAQERLGNCYYFGNGVEKDYIKAVQWFEKAAEQGHKMAQERLSDCYYFGNGVEKDYIQTVKWLEKAAEQGNASAQRKLGNCYYIGTGVEKDYIQTVKWLEKAAEQGNMSAQVSLGEFYYQGNGVKKDYIQAIKWTKKAAEQGSVFAQGKLGYYYYFGYGVEKNYSEAFAWFQKSAEKDNQSKINLAICYYHGCGIEQNYNLAVEWFQKVANQDDYAARAKTYLGICCYYGYGLEKNHEQAFNWFQKASEKNDSIGLLWLSYFHFLKNNQEDFLSFLFLASTNFLKDSKNYNYDSTIINGLFTTDIIDFLTTENKSPAKVILGFFYHYIGNEEKFLLLLDQASNQLDLIANYQLGKYHKELGNFEKSVEYLNRVKQEEISPFDEIDSTNKEINYKNDIKQWLTSLSKDEISDIERIKYQKQLEEKNKQLELQIEKTEAAYKALHEKEKEMLSFFTHTMRNALSSAPESLRQAIRLLGSEDYEKNKIHYEAINEITALFSTLSLVDCLVDTFKQSIYDPEKFKLNWEEDNTGEATPQWFIAAALRQSLNRIIFISNTRNLIKLLQGDSVLIKPTRKAFIEQVLPLDINKQGVESFYQWLNTMPAIDISIEEDTVQFGVNQIKFSLLFSITSELIFNALKYWDGTGQIQIRWFTEQDYYIFTVKNTCRKNASSNLAGTHQGLAFIKRLMELLDDKDIKTYSPAQFTCFPEEHSFTAELKLHKTLLETNS